MSDLDRLQEFVARHAPLTVLSGAGISTASGIPDYRDANGEWKNASPVQFEDFRSSDATRRRYWARSYAGWKNIRDAKPNAAHFALAALQRAAVVDKLITQNVDCLHDRAGATSVIDLHGRLDRVVCLDCGAVDSRERWQARLADWNPDWQANVDYYKPDGDAELDTDTVAQFRIPGCEKCDGMIKPDVVFFGENVPRERVDGAMQAVRNAGGLLVVGSSLMVFSGFRFARLAHQEGIPFAIVNRGKTRADELTSNKFDLDVGSALSRVAEL